MILHFSLLKTKVHKSKRMSLNRYILKQKYILRNKKLCTCDQVHNNHYKKIYGCYNSMEIFFYFVGKEIFS